MIIIEVGNRKIEYILKEYRQKVDKVGIVKELKDRKRFKKKSLQRREEIDRAKYRNKFNDKKI
jgi:small subunit ribosomal protein S21